MKLIVDNFAIRHMESLIMYWTPTTNLWMVVEGLSKPLSEWANDNERLEAN